MKKTKKYLSKDQIKEMYGVDLVDRPKIKAKFMIDLKGETGKQIIKSETKLVLRTHRATFKKLADM